MRSAISAGDILDAGIREGVELLFGGLTGNGGNGGFDPFGLAGSLIGGLGGGAGGVTLQVIDQRSSGGSIEQEKTSGANGEMITRLIVRDEIKKSGAGSVDQTASNYKEAKKRRLI